MPGDKNFEITKTLEEGKRYPASYFISNFPGERCGFIESSYYKTDMDYGTTRIVPKSGNQYYLIPSNSEGFNVALSMIDTLKTSAELEGVDKPADLNDSTFFVTPGLITINSDGVVEDIKKMKFEWGQNKNNIEDAQVVKKVPNEQATTVEPATPEKPVVEKQEREFILLVEALRGTISEAIKNKLKALNYTKDIADDVLRRGTEGVMSGLENLVKKNEKENKKSGNDYRKLATSFAENRAVEIVVEEELYQHISNLNLLTNVKDISTFLENLKSKYTDLEKSIWFKKQLEEIKKLGGQATILQMAEGRKALLKRINSFNEYSLEDLIKIRRVFELVKDKIKDEAVVNRFMDALVNAIDAKEKGMAEAVEAGVETTWTEGNEKTLQELLAVIKKERLAIEERNKEIDRIRKQLATLAQEKNNNAK